MKLFVILLGTALSPLNDPWLPSDPSLETIFLNNLTATLQSG